MKGKGPKITLDEMTGRGRGPRGNPCCAWTARKNDKDIRLLIISPVTWKVTNEIVTAVRVSSGEVIIFRIVALAVGRGRGDRNRSPKTEFGALNGSAELEYLKAVLNPLTRRPAITEEDWGGGNYSAGRTGMQ